MDTAISEEILRLCRKLNSCILLTSQEKDEILEKVKKLVVKRQKLRDELFKYNRKD